MREPYQREEQLTDLRKKARTEKKYFNKVFLSVTAAAKMLNHSYFGQPQQVMGLLQGFYLDKNGIGMFQVTDIISLPVQASQTRVTADDETYGLMATHSEWINKIGTHNIMGWYHSHPNFGCWLSGIDVDTSNRHQMMNDPFLSIVIDPIKSVNFQKLEVGAFRVYPNEYREKQSQVKKDVPRKKAVDFGYHYQRYYQLPIELYVDKASQKIVKNIERIQWSSELSQSSFFSQLDYLTEAVSEQKLDLEQYYELLEKKPSVDESKKKKKSTLSKISYYAQQRNLSLLDQSIKAMLF